MDNKKTVHSKRDFLFFLLLLGFIEFIFMSELQHYLRRLSMPFVYWRQLMTSNDLSTKDYFYYLLNGKS